MKFLARPKTQRLILLTLLIIGMSIFFWIQVQSASFPPIQPTNNPSRLAMEGETLLASTTPIPLTSYDPASYGLPDKIAGYDVLAAVPIESQMCAEPGSMVIVVVQFPQTDVDENEQISITQSDVLKVVRQIDFGFDIMAQPVGPTVTREKVRADYAYREKYWKEGGSPCPLPSVGLLSKIITLTPTTETVMASPTPD
jgi:hypothetical protein